MWIWKVKFLKNVVFTTLFQSKRLSIFSHEGSDDCVSVRAVADDCFISLVRLVDLTMRRNGVGELEGVVAKSDVLFVMEGLNVNIHIMTGDTQHRVTA